MPAKKTTSRASGVSKKTDGIKRVGRKAKPASGAMLDDGGQDRDRSDEFFRVPEYHISESPVSEEPAKVEEPVKSGTTSEATKAAIAAVVAANSKSNLPAAESTPASVPSSMPEIKPMPWQSNPVSDKMAMENKIPAKPQAPSTPVSSIRKDIDERDASFLAADSYSFNLRDKAVKPVQSSFLHGFVYFLSALMAVGAIVIFGILFYKYFGGGKSANQNQTAQQTSATNAAPAVASTTFSTAILGGNAFVDQEMQNLLTKQFAQLNYGGAWAGSSQLTAPADTILYKTNSKDIATQISTYLSKQGITMQLQEMDSLQPDLVVYLLPQLTSINLSGQVATVANATGVTGLAKKYCGYLTNYQVTSCTPSNASTPDTGLKVWAKNESAIIYLARTPEFSSAKFNPAQAGQTEDIRVSVGN